MSNRPAAAAAAANRGVKRPSEEDEKQSPAKKAKSAEVECPICFEDFDLHRVEAAATSATMHGCCMSSLCDATVGYESSVSSNAMISSQLR